MIRLRQLIPCLATTTLALAASAQPQFPPRTDASAATAISPPITPGLPPPTPQMPPSPVAFFRQLLSMTPAEQNNSLTNRAPAARARILAKVQEYRMLPSDERELRLRSTDLRWYLTPLLSMTPAERQVRLDQMPADMRELVESRLSQWDVLPPPLQQEFLANDRTLPYFAHVETANSAIVNPEQQRIDAQLKQFFDLTPEEKRQALNTLSDTERAEMEKTLKSFNELPPQQRLLCVRNYARFAGMSPAERADFLKNAQRWSQMSPQERQSWQDLVNHVPIWPPAPTVDPSTDVIMPPHPSKISRPGVGTNIATN